MYHRRLEDSHASKEDALQDASGFRISVANMNVSAGSAVAANEQAPPESLWNQVSCEACDPSRCSRVTPWFTDKRISCVPAIDSPSLHFQSVPVQHSCGCSTVR